MTCSTWWRAAAQARCVIAHVRGHIKQRDQDTSLSAGDRTNAAKRIAGDVHFRAMCSAVIDHAHTRPIPRGINQRVRRMMSRSGRTHVAFASSAVTHAHTHAVQARTPACAFDDGAERQHIRARHAAARPAFNQSSHTRASQSLRATRSVRRCLRRTTRSPSPGHLRARCALGSSADVARSR